MFDPEFVLSAVVVVAAVVASHVRMETRFNDNQNESARRFAILEKTLGIINGNAPEFVRRSECLLMEGQARKDLDRIEARIGDAAAVAVGRAGDQMSQAITDAANNAVMRAVATAARAEQAAAAVARAAENAAGVG